MSRMPAEYVDFILTDPPYNCGKSYDIWNDNLPAEKYWCWYKKVFTEVFRILKGRSYLYVSCLNYQQYIIKNLLEDIGFKWHQDLIWYGPNMSNKNSGYGWAWSPLFETIMLFFKGEKRQKMLNAGSLTNRHNVLIEPRPQSNYGNRYHICQKPLKLYRRIISRTPGKIIYDPFIGSGTVALASIHHDRNFIGSEISQSYVKIATERIERFKDQHKIPWPKSN